MLNFSGVPAQTSSFIGKPGVYVLGRLSIPMDTTAFNKPYVTGTAVRVKWDSVETSPGIFNWNFLDNEIAAAASYGKKISLLIVGYAGWLASLGVPTYDFIDNIPISPTYLDTLQAPITWSSQYLNHLSNLIQQLGLKYSNDTNVTYINCGAGNMNNNLPNHVASGADFWTATSYHPDTLVEKMKQVLDVYMIAFPNTPAWNSLENIWFEPQATGNPFNYVITQFASYGASTYPDRFGAWREDLTGCQNTTSSNSQWFTVASHPCRTGGQMSYSVQDGPAIMNQCGLVPNTKEFVLQSAFNKGFSMNMRYFELYKDDIDDTTLTAIIQNASDSTDAVYHYCNPALGTEENIIDYGKLMVYPNPSHNNFTVQLSDQIFSLEVLDVTGRTVIAKQGIFNKEEINCSELHRGIYLIRCSGITKSSRLFFKN